MRALSHPPRRVGFALACALVLSAFVPGVLAQTTAEFNAALDAKETAVNRMKINLEAALISMHNGTLSSWPTTTTHSAQSTCSATLTSPHCDKNFGNTAGCNCEGRTIDYTNTVVKTSPKLGASDYAVKKAAVLGSELESELASMYTSLIEVGDAKWLYFGTKDGVLVNYPGFIWGEDNEDAQCGVEYDSRLRPWSMNGATGPKNIILILDISGSMAFMNRMVLLKQAAKKVIDSATHADYLGIITFNGAAYSYAGLTTLAKGLPDFKARLKYYIDELTYGGGTNFIAGYEKAFELVDNSKAKNYAAACHTTYVFVTDGDAPSPEATLTTRGASAAGADEHHFMISLGSGGNSDLLRKVACDVGAVFTAVPDGEQEMLDRAMISFYKFYALQKTLDKQETPTWTEPYDSIPAIWGPLTSVSVPVYDKSREPWHMVGVASVDSTTCDLEAKAPAAAAEDPPTTARHCTCQSTWTYNGRTFEGCADPDWPVPWCATQAGCGSCDTASVGPSGCWDDCKPTGSEATLFNELLSRATRWCDTTGLPACAVESLREEMDGSTCAARYPSDFTACSTADKEYYDYALKGPTESAVDFDLTRTSGDIRGTAYDMNMDRCACDPTMLPTCSCAALPSPPPMEDHGVDQEAAGAIGGAVGGAVIFIVATAFCCCCRNRKRDESKYSNAGVAMQQQPQYAPQYPQQPMMPQYPQQQMPQYPQQPMQYGVQQPMYVPQGQQPSYPAPPGGGGFYGR